MTAHYFACSWLMTSVSIQFSQNPIVRQLRSTFGAKGLMACLISAEKIQFHPNASKTFHVHRLTTAVLLFKQEECRDSRSPTPFIPETTPICAWNEWYGYRMHDLPTLLLRSGDSVVMSHTATMPLVKLPAIILWIKQRTQRSAKHVAWILNGSIFVDHANN